MTRIVTTESNLQVVFEDNHIIVINKRIGDLVQGDKTKDPALSDIVKSFLKKKYNKQGNVFLGVTHRLDRPTSGLVIFAKSSKALTRLNAMFKNKTIKKIYWALVKNQPSNNKETLTHWLKKNHKTNLTTVYPHETSESKKAILHYNVILKLNAYFLLEIELETGRSHQIRSQLSFIGSPIKGDLKYGSERSNPNGGIHLHAKSVYFTHPVTKKPMTLMANPPEDTLWNECIKHHPIL